MTPKTERFEMRLDEATIAHIDGWREKQSFMPSRAEAIRVLIDRGLSVESGETPALSDGEKLIAVMLCDLHQKLGIEGELNPGKLKEILFGGHYWALGWEFSGLFHRHVDDQAVLREVVDILDMWFFIESSYKRLPEAEQRTLEAALSLSGAPRFAGFDGNNESEHCSIARFLVEDLGRWSEFKGRSFNCHHPSIDIHRRMLSAFLPLREKLADRSLNTKELEHVLSERIHPSNR